MSAKTSIEWTDRTWNPTRGCSRVSEGCRNCYAERMAGRGFSWSKGFATATPAGPRWTGKVALIPEALDEPLRWRKPQRVFVNSMSDLFHESLPNEAIEKVFAVMALATQHTFQVLTKRPARMRDWFASVVPGLEARAEDVARAAEWRGKVIFDGRGSARHLYPPGAGDVSNRRPWPGWPLPNVWLGTSVEDQATADERILLLLQTPAAVRFVSYEPALGPVDFEPFLWLWDDEKSDGRPRPRLDWLITGGESGPRARRAQVAWFRSARRQCRAAGVPFFMKQVGANVIDRNDAGFEAEHETWAEGPDAGRPTDSRAWPTPAGGVEDNIDGYRDDYQGAPVRVRLRDRKGGSMEEWPEDLRVREFPAVPA